MRNILKISVYTLDLPICIEFSDSEINKSVYEILNETINLLHKSGKIYESKALSDAIYNVRTDIVIYNNNYRFDKHTPLKELNKEFKKICIDEHQTIEIAIVEISVGIMHDDG